MKAFLIINSTQTMITEFTLARPLFMLSYSLETLITPIIFFVFSVAVLFDYEGPKQNLENSITLFIMALLSFTQGGLALILVMSLLSAYYAAAFIGIVK